MTLSGHPRALSSKLAAYLRFPALVTILFAISMAACNSAPTRLTPSSYPLGSRSSPSTEPARSISEGTDWLQKRYVEIERDLASGIELKKVRVLLVGDSITQFYAGGDDPRQAAMWRSAFGDRTGPNYALNLGVAGDRTENLLLRLLAKERGGFGQLDNPDIQPEIIVLMIGINNTWSSTADKVGLTTDGQVAVIKRLQELRPTSTIVVNSILPTNNAGHDRELVEPINRRLQAEVGKMKGIVWLDANRAFLKSDGSGNPKLFKDGVHPNADGYVAWSAELLPTLDLVRAARQAAQVPK